MANEPTKGPQTAKTAPLIHLLSQGRTALVPFEDDVLTLRSKSGETTETVRATDIADVQLQGQAITNRMTVQTKQGRSISIDGLDRATSQALQAQLHARVVELLNNEAGQQRRHPGARDTHAGGANERPPEHGPVHPALRHGGTQGRCPFAHPENRRQNAPEARRRRPAGPE